MMARKNFYPLRTLANSSILMCMLHGIPAQAATYSYLETTPSCASLSIAGSGEIVCNTSGANSVPFNFNSALTCKSGLNVNTSSGAVSCATKLPNCALSASPAQVEPGAVVTLTVNCDNAPTGYSWIGANALTPGSGNTATVAYPTTANSATYAYSVAGINSQGTGNIASALVTVARAGQKGPYAYIAHQADTPPLSGNLSVIDTSTNQLAASVKVGVYPAGVVVSPDETKVYVANAGSNTISVVDALTNTVAATIDVGQSPYGVAISSAGTRLYVANAASHTLSEIDAISMKVLRTIPVGKTPHGVAVNRTGSHVFVSNNADNTLTVIDVATGTALANAIPVGLQPEGVAVFGNKAFVANHGSNSLTIIDTANGYTATSIAIGKKPLGLAVTPNGKQVYAVNYGDRTVSVVDVETAKLVNTIAVGILPSFVAFDPAGILAYVTNQGENTVSVIDVAAGSAIAGKDVAITPGVLYGYGKFIGGAAENYQGLWWNPDESGWGLSIAQHNDMGFGALYTYDAAGKPIWYVMSRCPFLGTTCTGEIYKVTGGTSPLVVWNGGNKAVTQVGTGTLAFSGENSANFTYTIDGKTGSKAIIRQVFKTSGQQSNVDYTDLWWNSSESGWGIELTQQYETIFATWYTYNDKGEAIWYVASDCKMNAADAVPGCAGELYMVTGGTGMTVPWNAATKLTTPVGSLSITFSDASNGTMNYTINGTSATRAITRQVF